jgi:hypothetical protein
MRRGSGIDSQRRQAVATITEELAPAATIHCSVRGRITTCGDSASGYRVVCWHQQRIGFPDENDRCRSGLPTIRKVGDVLTDGHGDFAVAFDAQAKPFGACAFSSLVHVDLYDGATRVWVSGYRAVQSLVRFDHELLPGCTAGSTVVRVVDDDGRIVSGAQVFANATLRGTTDATGHVFLAPPLQAGDRVVARRLIRENATSKREHDTDSAQNWNYRVWITSLTVRHDAAGNNVTLDQLVVSDPNDVQQLRVRRSNALIGLNLRASIEWDASPTEFERIRDRLSDTSELLYNATDGQVCVEHLAISDDGYSWDDADIRVHADLNRGSNASKGGIFESDGRIRMNPNDAYYAGVYFHELGHYAFGLGDEYEPTDDWDPDNGPVRCTLRSTDADGPFATGNEKDACLMRGAQFEDQKKFCSAHPLNPHVDGTDQGKEDCWSDILERYSDPDRRWRLRTPVSRGAIVSRLPDSGVRLSGLTQPPGVARTRSFIPIADWKTRIHALRVEHLGLCPGLVVRVTRGGVPVIGAIVTLHTSHGRNINQGVTKSEYELAYDVQTGPGELPVRGAHVGDEINVYEWRGPLPVHTGRKRIDTCAGPLVVEPTFALPVTTETSLLAAPPPVAPVLRSVWPGERADIESRDGRLRLVLPPGALAEAGVVHLELVPPLSAREQLVSGPYAVTGPPKDRLERPAQLRFLLPSSEARTYADLHVVRLEAGGRARDVRSSVTTDPFVVSAAVDRLGTYALVDRRTS